MTATRKPRNKIDGMLSDLRTLQVLDWRMVASKRSDWARLLEAAKTHCICSARKEEDVKFKLEIYCNSTY